MPQYRIVSGTHYDKDGRRYDPGDMITLTEDSAAPFLDKLERLQDPVRIVATEAAEELADKYNIDLRDVEGTGKDGRILKGDVGVLLNGDAE